MNRLVLIILLIPFTGISQETFTKNIGGDKFDRALFITHTSDNGYIACGYTNSFDVNGSYDIYLVKTDGKGNVQWQKNYGGNKMDIGWTVLELKDKGYLLHGSTSSRKDTARQDIYLSRLDALGNTIWEKTYGNEKYERTTCLLPTTDGNYLLIGQRTLVDNVNIDSYIIKIDTAGNIIWEKVFGGPRMERMFYGAETRQGDYLLSGVISPYENDKADILLLKITKAGELVWSKSYGEKEIHDISHSFNRNSDGRTFTLTGYTESSKAGFHDALFMQMDEEGNVLTTRRHHTGDDIRLMHAEETKDKGFIVTGYTRSDISKNVHDAILLKYDKKGNVEWLKTFGTPDVDDQGYWIIVNQDGGYTFTGYTHSHGAGGDLWIIKTNALGSTKM